MYDHITCKAPLPLTEELVKLNVDWTGAAFQTKDLDNSLDHYIIDSDGYLYIENIEREYVEYTEEEKKTLNPKPWNVYKEVSIKSKTLDKVAYHGTVVFYDIVSYSETEDMWVEFSASFIYGKLDKLELTETKKMKSNALCTLEFEEEQRRRAASPWGKFKTFATPYGWRRLWLALARLCNNISRVASKLQTLIFKHML